MQALFRWFRGDPTVRWEPVDAPLHRLLGNDPGQRHIAAAAEQALREIDAVADRELGLFQAGLDALQRLERECDEALLQFPFDHDVVFDLIGYRAQQVRQAVHDLARGAAGARHGLDGW